MAPLRLFKCLADNTRLKMLLMITQHQELCVCELSEALDESQPKISRHLALLKKNRIIQDRRQGQWVYYRLHDHLPEWCHNVLQDTLKNNLDLHLRPDMMLANSGDRPNGCD